MSLLRSLTAPPRRSSPASLESPPTPALDPPPVGFVASARAMVDSLTMSGSSSVFHSRPFDPFKGTRPTHTDAPSMTRGSGSVKRSFSSFSRDGELRTDFAGRQKQFVVELRAEEERRAPKCIKFWTNRLEQAHALRCDQRSQSANHIQAGCLSRTPCWKVVENDPVDLEFDGERQCLPLPSAQASAQQ
jgi:hypothetical protein